MKSWRSITTLDLTKDTTLWWGIPHKKFINRLKTHSLRKILQSCGDRLQKIDSSDNRTLSRIVIENAGEFCPNLEAVDIAACSWAILDNKKSLVACKRLKKIVMKKMICESFLMKLFAGLKHLRRIEIHGKFHQFCIGSSFFNLPETIESICLLNVDLDRRPFKQVWYLY